MLRKPNEIIINGKSLEKIISEQMLKKQGIPFIDPHLDLSGLDLSYADLKDIDLSYSDLSRTDLRGANLEGTNLEGVDLRYSDLRYSELSSANLSGANISGVELSYSDLSNSCLSDSDLSGSDLRYSDLSGADISGANLKGAELSNSILNKVKYDHRTAFFAMQCPEEGSIVGYKKANDKIVKLLILEDSKRSSATSRKCRCDKAKVLSIESADGKEKFTEAESDFDCNFIYRVGEIVKVDNFCEDRWEECAAGIHFFITKQEAINY